MQRLVLLALVVCLASAAIDSTHQVLAEIDQDAFGNIVLSAIQTHIQAKSPADEVNLLLNQLMSSIVDDQSDSDNLNSTNQAACSRITFDLSNAIAYHDAQISSNTQLRDDSEAALADAEVDVRQTVQDISDNEDTYSRELATRDQQHATFETKDSENASATEAVDEAAKLIQHLQLGASFVQVKSRFDSVQKKLQQQTSHQSLFKPIIVALTELATEVDFKAIAAIAQLIGEIRQQLVSARQVLQQTEQRQADHYVEFSLHLTNEHTRLVERKNQLEASISLNKSNIASAEEYLEYHTVELENAEDALEQQEDWCAVQSNNYEEQSVLRSNQAELIQRIQEHVTEHLSAAAQFLELRKVD